MTVGELRLRLEGVPHDLEVLTGASDHSYRILSGGSEMDVAFCSDDYEWAEYASDEHLCPGEVKARGFVID